MNAANSVDLVAEWHPTKNGDIDFSSLAKGSHKKYWWKCEDGHEWEARMDHRSNGHGCPYCSGVKAIPGVNDLATLFPEVVKEWHPTKNENLNPSETGAYSSSRKIWWLGKCGHEWEAALANRTKRGDGCPTCGGKKILPGFNDVATTHPDLLKIYNPGKNNGLQLNEVSKGSHKRLTWNCEQSHEWEATVFNIARGYGCPYCSGRKRVKGVNDLMTTHPNIGKELHPTKNTVDISSLSMTTSSTKVWWQCEKGHEWKTTPYNRSRGDGCPHCSKRISKAEKTIVEFLRSLNLEVVTSERKILEGKELDIYIPSHSLAVEFNGVYWHTEKAGKSRTYHYDKWASCNEKRIQLIQVWSDDYLRNPDLVHRMLAHKLGLSSSERVFARKTLVKTLRKTEAETFLNAYHIQGFVSGSNYLGLFFGKELVAVLVVKKDHKPGVYHIVRYATSMNVVGGFTKLLTYVEKVLKPSLIVTFSDNTVSNGGLYKSNGFVADKELAPDYMYVVGGSRREHKFKYRLVKFRNDSELLYKEGYTESQLAELNGLERIWDAGKTRWIKKLSMV